MPFMEEVVLHDISEVGSALRWYHTPALTKYWGFYCWSAEPSMYAMAGFMAEFAPRHFVPVFSHLSSVEVVG